MGEMNTRITFERIDHEGEEALESLIAEGSEAFAERFGFDNNFEEFCTDAINAITRSKPTLDEAMALTTYLGQVDKHIIVKVLWQDSSQWFFGSACLAPFWKEGETWESDDGDATWYRFHNDLINYAQEHYQPQLKEAGVDTDDTEQIEEWLEACMEDSNCSTVSEIIDAIQHTNVMETLNFLLPRQWTVDEHGNWDFCIAE